METKEAAEIRHLMNDVLTKNGEGARLKDMLTRLLVESGWKDEVNLMCRKVIQERGVDNITTDDIVNAVTPNARASVPAEVKKALLEKIRAALIKELEDREKENGTQ
ncbi:Transcription and mRNA export factor ENY2 [Orchesella cincta]|uniref:Transcription and mRNA export factor ENY2 n=1 Tax=Orchesella cincta TaxID=48709 RepID=A0A1D2MNX7_ORCCI|nr:Transcription and mRNA export factor ENY2 [Orchesella cincta]